ncbi:f-box only protein [Anaeramoeba ignava]|uniref:F-box only protein n=1 Tax=Anaeramoeba ignava TaxID=1746090 RepID=A0A9Q0R7M4_ANAIG|nr:f-box only protein [Anaeramoeba ignava]
MFADSISPILIVLYLNFSGNGVNPSSVIFKIRRRYLPINNNGANEFVIFSGKGVYVITDERYKELIDSPFINSDNIYEAPEIEQETILEKLPEEIILEIGTYLSPPELMRFGLTCVSLWELIQDQALWRNLAKNYNKLYIWDKLDIQPIIGLLFTDIDTPFLESNKEDKIKDNANVDGNVKDDVFDNQDGIDNITTNPNPPLGHFIFRPWAANANVQPDKKTTKEVDGQLVPVEITTPKARKNYIKLIDDPRESVISRMKLLKEKMKEKAERHEQYKEQQKLIAKRMRKRHILESILGISASLFHFALITSLILLAVARDTDSSSLTTTKIFSPTITTFGIFGIIIFLMIFVQDSNSTFRRDDIIGLTLFSTLVELIVLSILFVSLKNDGIVSFSWKIAFIPIFIVLGFLTLIMIASSAESYRNQSFISLFLINIWIILLDAFFILLLLKLNGNLTANYFIIFIPLFILFFLPCFSFIFATCQHLFDMRIMSITFICLALPLLIFFILLAFYLEGKIAKLSLTLIPVFIELGVFLFGTVIGFIFAIFELIRNIRQKNDFLY